MEELIQYILAEVKAHRIDKQESLKLLSQLKLPYYYSKGLKLTTLKEQGTTYEYSCTLSQYDCFIVDHVVGGQHILPGSVYLEMARIAYLSCHKVSDNIVFDNIVWLMPLIVNQEEVTISIRMILEADKSQFEISSVNEIGDEVMHCQGMITSGQHVTHSKIDIEDEPQDWQIIDRKSCYEDFRTNGFEYGLSHKVIEQLKVNKRAIVAQLVLPKFLQSSLGAYGLHPSMLDATFQSAIGFEYHKHTDFIPFSIEHMEVREKFTAEMHVMILKDSQHYDDRIHKMHLQLINSEDEVVMDLKGFVCKSNIIAQTSTVEYSTVEYMENRLKVLLAETIKLPTNRVRVQETFDTYGIDSVLVLKMTKALEKLFGPLPKTLFFENRNIEELATYFVEQYRDEVKNLMQAKQEQVVAKSKPIMKQVQPMVQEASKCSSEEDIAIIGIAGRYPQADNIEVFWNHLKDGEDSISEIPSKRWDHSFFYDERKDIEGKTYAKWGGFLSDVDTFDAFFFHISPHEAERMDPQEKLFLECVYHAIEDAGYTRDTLDEDKHNVGVFVGVMYEEYQLYGAEETIMGNPVSLNGSNASIANRISYYCDFHGPSIAMDTMCSSSLTAVHLACQMLKHGECNVAIAGGVNVSIHPNKYIMLAQDHFASSKGRCESFGKDGDGYVPGEGVGAIVLKPLTKAIKDHDHIYGVIKGTAINHGGKTNGYSVPSPKAQGDVITKALKQAAVHPRTISYVEAHGTGTSLGDPIEIAGLTQAFNAYTNEKQFCAIGSVKSNVGHCESAAGIASVTKVLLQMKYKQLVPSLHAKQLNPHIDFEKTPFYVQQALTDWQRPTVEENGETIVYPRRAAISSFGAGGANAHLILEEYEEKIDVRHSRLEQADRVILLSAKTKKQLKEVVHQLDAFIQTNHEINLQDIAYTLAVGREHKEERLGLIVQSMEDLQNKLSAYLEENINQCYLGDIYDVADIEEQFVTKENKNQTIAHLLEQKDLKALIELWCQGIDVRWMALFDLQNVKRLALPVYPFDKKRYWYPKAHHYGTCHKTYDLHPLIHENISTFTKQEFICRLTGKEEVVDGHRINEVLTVPGASYIEMVIAAVHLSFSKDELSDGIKLEQVYWVRPLTLDKGPKELRISLEKQDNQMILFTITVNDEEKELICEGKVSLLDSNEVTPDSAEIVQWGAQKREFTKEACYHIFEKNGLGYGKYFQCIEKLEMDEHYLLAQVQLDESMMDTTHKYWLHPLLLDSAFQTIVGFYMQEEKLMLPFFIEKLEVLHPLETFMQVEVFRKVIGHDEDRFDIRLINKNKTICCNIEGFLLKDMQDKKHYQPVENTLLIAHKVWQPSLNSHQNGNHDWEKRYIVHTDEINLPEVQNTSEVIIEDFHFDLAQMEISYEQIACDLLRRAKDCMMSRPKKDILIQFVICHDGESRLLSGLIGMLKTITLENPKIKTQLIEVSQGTEVNQLLDRLHEDCIMPEEIHIRYHEDRRLIQSWQEEQLAPVRFCKNHGVYLITGGCGGLGLVFAKELLTTGQDITLVLTGRRPLNAFIQEQLESLTQMGGHAIYLEADMAHKQDVQKVIETIQTEYHQLDGIIHSAGVTRDNFIIRKSNEEFVEVLKPKVKGTTYLDECTKEMSLDFFVLFASGTGAFGNVGQADYAAANGFMDAFAHYRNQLVDQKVRSGKTLSIDWPLWKEGGMQVDEETERAMREDMGLALLETPVGIQGFYSCYGSNQNQLFVAQGNHDKIRTLLLKAQEDDLLPFMNTLADYLHIECEEVDVNVAMYEYGLDEIRLMEFIQMINKVYHTRLDHKIISLEDTLKDLFEKIKSLINQSEVSEMHEINKPITHLEDQTQVQNKKQELKQVEAFIKKLLAPIIKLPTEEIEARVDLENYGLNSIMILKFNQKLEEYLKQVSKTLLYEYKSISALAEFLLETYRQQLSEKNILQLAKPLQVSKVEDKSALTAVVTETHQIDDVNDDIAIIGLAGKYPKAENMTEFWHNLKEAVDSIVEVPENRWNNSQYFSVDKDQTGKTYSKWGGFLKSAYDFDPEFFNITPREAYLMDPQERLFLQCAYETIEDAGYTKQSIKRANMDIGVYVGVMYDEYQMYSLNQDAIMASSAMVGNNASIANRVSYFFGFNGPSIALNTMCSSSLTTIHLACQSLRLQECDMALAGGVNLSVHPNKYLALSQSKFLSSKGRCQAFGEGGDGYVPGEGVGAVLLKSLKNALRDGDHIYGVIKGSAINHGGKTNGYTVPNPVAQGQLIKKVYDKANIDPRWVSYIEAHGTGTLLGDPIEITGLKAAFGERTQDKQFCAIGSVKTNIGHCESAAGIAAMSKVLMQLKHKKIVASLHSTKLNQNIDFEQSPFKVPQALIDWKRPVIDGTEVLRYAGVSAFGAGGSNAHIILSEFEPSKSNKIVTRDTYYIILSARDQDGLYRKAHQLLEFMQQNPMDTQKLESMSYTLLVGREQMATRFACICHSIEELKKQLEQFINQMIATDCFAQKYYQLSELTFDYQDEDEIQNIMNQYIQQHQEAELLKLWVSGVDMDFRGLFKAPYPEKMSLPTYPFNNRPFFINQRVNESTREKKLAYDVKPLRMVEKYQRKENTNQEKVDSMKKIKLETVAPYEVANVQDTTSPVVDNEQIRKFLVESLANVLYMDVSNIKVDQKFVDLGLDSVVGVEWIKLINKKYQLKLAATKIYDYPTINDFTRLLNEQLDANEVKPETVANKAEVPKPDQKISELSAKVNLEALEEELANGLADVLYMEKDQIQKDKKFIDLGLDSVVGVEWIKWINKKYGLKLPATKIYDYPTINDFAKLIGELLSIGDSLEPPVNHKVKLAPMENESTKIIKTIPKEDIHELEEQLTIGLADVLYMNKDQIQRDKKFIDLGLDSVVGVEWIKWINKQYGTKIPATKIYDYPTIQEFAQHLSTLLEKKHCPISNKGQNQKVQLMNEAHFNEEMSKVDELVGEKGLVLHEVSHINEIKLSAWHVEPPKANEVKIEVRASAINYPDIMCINGIYPTIPEYPFVPGFEVAGVITEVGHLVRDYQVGDEVIAITGPQLGGHSDYVNVLAEEIVKKPSNISFEEACSLPIVFSTVAYALEVSKIQEKERILIQAATGGIGLMAIQFANLYDCMIYGTSSKVEKLELLKTLGLVGVYNYMEEPFDKRIKEATDNGVDIVLNTLAGDVIQKGLQSLAPSGRYLELAVHGLKASKNLDLSTLVNNQAFMSIDLRKMALNKKIKMKHYLEKMVQMVEEGAIVPIVSRIYPLEKIKEAMQYVSKGEHIGKVVISHQGKAIIDLKDKCIADMQLQKKHKWTDVPAMAFGDYESSHAESKSSKVAQEVQTNRGIHLEEIAIIGVDGVFPDANNIETFFQNLMEGKDSVREVPHERFCIDDYYDQDRRALGKTYSRWMGSIDGLYEFDPLFFNISPAEAQLMDPQQRLFLQSCWKCFEDAGFKAEDVKGSKCGIFVGCAGSDYEIGMQEENYTVQSLLGQSTSILAARIAYLLNLVGPCLSIETACSSSLVAIAEACNNLVLHHCDMAIAGGVYTISSPIMHIRASKAGMLSADGKCHTFDNHANGFVPGEGVGTLLLKRLSDAQRDNDHIYGVIKGWGVNQDGKTNGITAPSVQSQIALEKEIYHKFHINPEHITLIEAHGTGTKLGDPIEVEALTTAFREFTDRKNYCALGSVKANIGHLLMGAGVASVIKVLQAMRYKKIPGLVHYHQLNEYIALEDSPFYINKETIDWITPHHEKRMAAVSAFGFSGTNAHLVIEEYEMDNRQASHLEEIDHLFVLSATTESQLKEYTSLIANYIESHDELKLENINYTVKVGRNDMACRMALYAEDKADLLVKLHDYWKMPHSRKSIKVMATPALNEDIKAYLDGSSISWRGYYTKGSRQVIHLPGYPFLKEIYYTERYFSGIVHQTEEPKAVKPLNMEYTMHLTGNEAFLRDHKIGEHKVLPASAYVALSIRAMQHILGDVKGSLRLAKLSWRRPIAMDLKEVTIKYMMTKKSATLYAFKIVNESQGSVICCEGEISYIEAKETPKLELKSFDQGAYQQVLLGEQCYASFEEMGMHYGITHRGIQAIYLDQNRAYVKLKIDDPEFTRYHVHPGLLDSAMQATIGFAMHQASIGKIKVAAIGEIIVWAQCQQEMNAILKQKDNKNFDIELYNLQGKLCMTVSDILLHMEQKKETSSLYLGAEQWKSAEVAMDKNMSEAKIVKRIFLGFKHFNTCEATKGLLEKNMVLDVNIDQSTEFINAATILFEKVKTLAETCGQDKMLLQLIVPFKAKGNFYRAFYPLMKTMMLEKPNIGTQIIEVDELAFNQDLEALMNQNSHDLQHIHIQHHHGTRYVKEWQAIDTHTIEERHIFKDHGIYLLFGGAKGIGLLFAKEILKQTKGATLILVGKSKYNETIKQNMEQLYREDTHICYECVDVCNTQEVQQLYHKIKASYGYLNGVLFGAGIIKDHLMVHKTTNEYVEVLKPKVEGLINVDETFADEKLDFFLLCSSVSGCMGNIGQSDYAVANGFLNEYAVYRNQMVSDKKRFGRTIAMNWSLWEEGGFQLEGRKALKRASLSTKKGIQSIYLAYATHHDVIIAMEGDEKEIKAFWKVSSEHEEEDFYKKLIQLVKENKITKEEFKRRLINQRGESCVRERSV